MKNVLVVVSILTIGLNASLGAQETEPELTKLQGKAKAKAEPFSVIQIGDEVKIVKKSELSGLKKDIETRYRTALKEHARAKADARKAKEAFTSPRPVKEKLTVLAATVKTEEAAEKLREKVLNDYLIVKLNDQLKVIRKLEYASFKAKLDADYRVALAKYGDEKKAAKKSRQVFRNPAPAKPKIRVLASRLTSEDAANEKLEALQNKSPRSKAIKSKEKAKTRKTRKDEKDEKDEDEEKDDEDEKDEDEEKDDEDEKDEDEEKDDEDDPLNN